MRTPPKVLVIDDEPAITELVCDILEEDGYDLVCTTSADQALEQLDRGAVDVVIADINLGGKIDGFEVVKRARAMKPDAKIIYTSGAAARRVAYEGIRGAAFIPKPFTPAEISNALLWMMNEPKAQAA